MTELVIVKPSGKVSFFLGMVRPDGTTGRTYPRSYRTSLTDAAFAFAIDLMFVKPSGKFALLRLVFVSKKKHMVRAGRPTYGRTGRAGGAYSFLNLESKSVRARYDRTVRRETPPYDRTMPRKAPDFPYFLFYFLISSDSFLGRLLD